MVNLKLIPKTAKSWDIPSRALEMRDLTRLTDFLTWGFPSCWSGEVSIERGRPFSLDEMEMNNAKGNIQMQMPKKEAISVKEG